MPKKAGKINQLTSHKFIECSDLPYLGRIGIFSCSACDRWRQRIHSRGYGKAITRRDFLSDRYQCSREKRGLGPIKIRIVFNGDSKETKVMGVDNVSNSQETNSSISRKVPRHQLTIKKKHVAEITSRLESSKREIAIQRKSERARMLIMNLTRAKLAEDQKK
jgi:hypothetical protein